MKHTEKNIQAVESEFWKDICEYEGYYQASNFGRIRSIDRFVSQKNEKGELYSRLMKGKIIQPRKQNGGYLIVWLCKNGKSKALTVHRIIANTFIPNVNCYSDVNHRNGNKEDNRINNLEWCTRSENIRHAYSNLKHGHWKTRVKCVETGFVYESIKEAALDNEAKPSSVGNNINGRIKSVNGLHFVKLNNHFL